MKKIVSKPAGPPPPPPPDAILMQMLFGALMQKTICIAARLLIADRLAEKSQTAEELAAQSGVHGPSLYRILRSLASMGIFRENDDHTFQLTELGSLLRTDVPNSLHPMAIMMGEEWMWQAWGELMYSVKTGGIAHDKIQGMSSFEFFTKNQEAGKVFHAAMTNLSLASAGPITEAYDFSGIGTLMDIAGGHGLLLSRILKANTELQGILFDLPSVIEGAGELLDREGVRNRVALVAGDFFQSVPSSDAYILKHIIHDWNDADSVRILRSIRASMNENGRVLLCEMVVPEGNDPSPSKALDLMMLVMEGGKERTAAEYEQLFKASGLRLNRIIPTRSPYSILEGLRA